MTGCSSSKEAPPMIRKSVFQAVVAVAFAGAALIVQAAEATKPAPARTPRKEIRYVAIQRTISGKEHAISLGQYGKFSGHLVEGGLGGAAKIVNPPGADPLHKEYDQGTTTLINFNDAGKSWNFENSNYMFGTFQLDSELYEKYAAGLAQKMAAKKN